MIPRTKQGWLEANDYGKECLVDDLLAINADLLAALKAAEEADCLLQHLNRSGGTDGQRIEYGLLSNKARKLRRAAIERAGKGATA